LARAQNSAGVFVTPLNAFSAIVWLVEKHQIRQTPLQVRAASALVNANGSELPVTLHLPEKRSGPSCFSYFTSSTRN
jgi:hypothetical protein